MICPHCKKTIREERRYLMSRDPNSEMVWTPEQRKLAMYVLAFVILAGLIQILSSHL